MVLGLISPNYGVSFHQCPSTHPDGSVFQIARSNSPNTLLIKRPPQKPGPDASHLNARLLVQAIGRRFFQNDESHPLQQVHSGLRIDKKGIVSEYRYGVEGFVLGCVLRQQVGGPAKHTNHLGGPCQVPS